MGLQSTVKTVSLALNPDQRSALLARVAHHGFEAVLNERKQKVLRPDPAALGGENIVAMAAEDPAPYGDAPPPLLATALAKAMRTIARKDAAAERPAPACAIAPRPKRKRRP